MNYKWWTTASSLAHAELLVRPRRRVVRPSVSAPSSATNARAPPLSQYTDRSSEQILTGVRGHWYRCPTVSHKQRRSLRPSEDVGSANGRAGYARCRGAMTANDELVDHCRDAFSCRLWDWKTRMRIVRRGYSTKSEMHAPTLRRQSQSVPRGRRRLMKSRRSLGGVLRVRVALVATRCYIEYLPTISGCCRAWQVFPFARAGSAAVYQ